MIFAVTLAHAAIDAAKLFAVPASWLARGPHRSLAVFLGDQFAHGVSIVLAAGLGASAFADGLWAALLSPDRAAWLLSALAAGAGFIVATRAGGFAMALFMARFSDAAAADDSTNKAPPVSREGTGCLINPGIFALSRSTAGPSSIAGGRHMFLS